VQKNGGKPAWRAAWAAVVRFLGTLLAEYQRDQCLARAGGLAFAPLLSLVPMLALLFSLFSALGSFSGLLERFQAFLITQLVPASQEEIMAYVQRFVQNSRTLGAVGLLFYLGTAVLLLNAVHNSFNALWGSRPRRKSLHRLATYASRLIVGSFLLSIGLNLFGAAGSLVGAAGLGRSLAFLTAVAPSLFIFLALLLMIALLPSGRVRPASALGGAAAGLVLWELARRLFFFWITHVLRMSMLYGSLAVMPIFLIWLYVAWALVLLALEIAYVFQHRRFPWLGRSPMRISPADRLLLGLQVFLDVAGRFHRGESPPSREQIADRLDSSPAEVDVHVELLHGSGLLAYAGAAGELLMPARSLDRISLQDLMACLFRGSPRPTRRGGAALGLYEAVIGAADGYLADRTVLDFITSGYKP